MAESETSRRASKKLIRIDISSDNVCPWCYVGKINLDKAIAASKDQFHFEIHWHPFFLEPSAPKEGVNKRDFYKQKFGSQYEQIIGGMAEIYRGLGLDYNMDGLTGNTLDSHRLILFAGQQGLNKQHELVELILDGYMTKGKYIGDWEFLIECAKKVELKGAAEFLKNPNNGLKEVNEDFQKYSAHLGGVPYYVINGQHKFSGGLSLDGWLGAFQVAAKIIWITRNGQVFGHEPLSPFGSIRLYEYELVLAIPAEKERNDNRKELDNNVFLDDGEDCLQVVTQILNSIPVCNTLPYLEPLRKTFKA
ncbi:hypothetical protein KSS87_018201, partial [Heliosperma pusillum]